MKRVTGSIMGDPPVDLAQRRKAAGASVKIPPRVNEENYDPSLAVFSDLILARKYLRAGRSLSDVAAFIGVTKASLDLVLWRGIGR